MQFKQHLADWGRGDFDILVTNAGTLHIAAFDRVTEDDQDTVSNPLVALLIGAGAGVLDTLPMLLGKAP